MARQCGGGHHHPPFGPGAWFSFFMGKSPRAERGEVRLLILDAIAEQPRHGYDIIQTIEQRTGGYRPSPGTVYPTLQLLEEMGHAKSREEEGRKVYTITDEGRAELERQQDELEDAYERLGFDSESIDGAAMQDIFGHFRKMMRTFGKGFKHGKFNSQKMEEVESVIKESITRIEEILNRK
mgnify:CR=1 FL=1